MMERPICAVATPAGRSAVGMIRLSGEKTLELLSSIFFKAGSSPLTPTKPGWLAARPRRALFGKIIDPRIPDIIIDEVIVLPFVAPFSYTGEEAAEIHAHGNPLVLEKIIELLYKIGFEPARPGEFTRRAFLNGKLDLTEAEAVHEIISARGEKELQRAQLLKEGAFRKKILQFRSDLLNLAADLTAELDFGDEDIQFVSREQKLSQVRTILDEVAVLVADSQKMELFREGIEVVIAGAPNAGKSSLLNYLIGKDRALVSDTPGTTRDYLEAPVQIGGIRVKYIDTAGIRSETSSETERAGIQKSFEKLTEADLILYLIDSSLSPDALDLSPLKELLQKKPSRGDSGRVLLLLNKSDRIDRYYQELFSGASSEGKNELIQLVREFEERFSGSDSMRSLIAISVKTGEGMQELQNRVSEIIEEMTPHSSLVPAAWQREVLEEIREELAACYQMIKSDESPELSVQSLRNALDHFSELTGEVTTEDILGRVFSRFCIGK